MFKKITVVILTLIIFLSNPIYSITAEQNQPDIDLYAQAAVLMDAKSGRILYGKNADEVLAMASTTKIMTLILALEYGDMSDYVEVSAYAARMPKVKLNMRAGEFYRLEDLLYSLMLESHNDTAVAIAEHIGGSVEEFAEMMNGKAKEIGCKDTFFITPSGLDAETNTGLYHSTTARELALIMSYCILESPKKDDFLRITATMSHQFSNYKQTGDEYKSGGRNFSVTNRNAFLGMMDGAFSGKTGFTSKAGYCYVGALEQDGRIYIVSLLACGWPNNRRYKWSDTRKLMEYGLENYEYRDVFIVPEVQTLPVDDGKTKSGSPYLTAYAELKIISDEKPEQRLLRADEKVSTFIQLPDRLTAPVEAGSQVGFISYQLNGEKIKEYPIVLQTSIDRIDYRFIFGFVLNLFCV